MTDERDATEKMVEAGTEVTDRPEPPSDEARKASDSFFKRTLRDPIAAFTFLILLVNTAYLVVTSFQLQALYRSNEGSQRAWLLPLGTTPMAREVNGQCPIIATAEDCCPGLPPKGKDTFWCQTFRTA